MRTSESKQNFSGRPRESRRTLEQQEQWLMRGYQDSPDFSTLPEEKILAGLPERDELHDRKARTRHEKHPEYSAHPDRIQHKQIAHQLRKMNYLKMQAAQAKAAGNPAYASYLAVAWEVRQDLAGELFWTVQYICNRLHDKYPDQDFERLYEIALDVLYTVIDNTHWQGSNMLQGWFNNQVSRQTYDRTVAKKPKHFRLITNVPDNVWDNFEAPSESTPHDSEATTKFLDSLFVKLKTYRPSGAGVPMSEKYLAAFREYITSDSRLEEIAAVLGVTYQAVQAAVPRVLRNIRQLLKEDRELLAQAIEIGLIEDEADVNLLIARVLDRFRS